VTPPMDDSGAMDLYLASAIGRGRTELSAFDAALLEAGVANFNLIRLSSVIPGGATLHRVPRCPFSDRGEWGDRLYAVYADSRTSRSGEQVWAGVGWVRDPVTGQGLFVEHEGHDEAAVRGDIVASLDDLARNRGIDAGEPQMVVEGAMCTGSPTCALVICGYATAAWSVAREPALAGVAR
jgi:arginine decarboxylase